MERSLSPAHLTWRRFRKNRVSMISLGIILSGILVALLGYLISPDKIRHANTQVLEIALEDPGFRCDFLEVPLAVTSPDKSWVKRLISGKDPVHLLVPITSYNFTSDSITVKEYSRFETDEFYSTYSLQDLLGRSSEEVDEPEVLELLREEVIREHIKTRRFLLGTDRFGRDMLSRIILGTRVSMAVGFIAVSISLLIGILLGGIAGYFRGWVDQVIMWLVNVVWSIPTLLMVISITFVLGKGYWQVFVAVGLTMWVEVARVVRGQVLSIREKEFVEAARVIGLPPFRILFRHIIPNVLTAVIIISAANFATAILLEAGLSFLGIGIQPPIPTWGGMIRDHYGFIIVGKGYLAIVPGLAILVMVLAFTLLGNGIRDALESRLAD